MAEGGDGENFIVEVIKALFSLVGEMAKALISVLPKLIFFIFWVLSAVIILPCVFVAGNIYPQWVKWGEDF